MPYGPMHDFGGGFRRQRKAEIKATCIGLSTHLHSYYTLCTLPFFFIKTMLPIF